MKRIKYFLNSPVNMGTEETPVWVNNLLQKDVTYTEANEEIVKAEAYNGEYEIYDDGKSEPETSYEETVWDELDAAYQEGVDSV